MLTGNTGKILKINLSKGEFSILSPSEKDYQLFLGGSGLAAKIFFEILSEELDPLSPENPLGFFVGPLVGTRAPNCGRHVVCAKSPLTNIWGEANSGGKFGTFLKFLGYDGLIVLGKATDPVYIYLSDNKKEILSADKLWGKDSFETGDFLQQKHQKMKTYTCIGQAGENLVKISSVMNDGDRAAGRTGLGAVMGSKNLKAIALAPANRNVQIAKEEEFNQLAKTARKTIRDQSKSRRKYGTASYVSGGMKYGDVPIKYWYKGTMEGTEEFDGKKMVETILIKRYHCYGCVIGCGRIIKIDEGKYLLPETGGPEYETLAGFGTNLMVKDLEGISYANYLCNAYGIDTISTSQLISFVYHCYEKGIITPEKLGGIVPEWGKIGPAIDIIEKLVTRQGVGDLLAEGLANVADELEIPEEAHTVNRMALPYHDPRAFFPMATVYATSSRGACHNNGDAYKACLGLDVPEVGYRGQDRFDDRIAGKLAVDSQDYRAVYNGLIMCHFAAPKFPTLVGLLSTATGWDYTIESLLMAGERITNLKRLLNKKLGLTKANDTVPKIVTTPLKEGGTEGKVPQLEIQLEEYYNKRQWDTETGFPLKEKIKDLELEEFV
jgi:aldehyde:ferredoxin oxidoreductase